MFNNVSPNGIDPIYFDLPKAMRREPTASEMTANFVNSLKLLNKQLGQENSTESERNPNPCRLLAAGTYMAYARHLAKLNQFEEAIVQVEKAEKIYRMIDFDKIKLNQSANQLIHNCKVLKDAYSTVETRI